MPAGACAECSRSKRASPLLHYFVEVQYSGGVVAGGVYIMRYHHDGHVLVFVKVLDDVVHVLR